MTREEVNKKIEDLKRSIKEYASLRVYEVRYSTTGESKPKWQEIEYLLSNLEDDILGED